MRFRGRLLQVSKYALEHSGFHATLLQVVLVPGLSYFEGIALALKVLKFPLLQVYQLHLVLEE